ncbi:MAG: diaminopimelate epimerase [Acidobacteriota bacterium]|nr:diaminopimelate epimerase [Acidobacteriota bacterium]
MQFCKFHGFGNDYLILEAEGVRQIKSLGDFARQICDRHYGAGADGIAIVEKLKSGAADFSARIFNPDGSEAGFSGNGTRCAVAYLHYKKLWTEENLRLKTKSGVKNYRLLETIDEGHYRFEAELGKPKLDSDSVPLVTKEKLETVVDFPLSVGAEEFKITALNVGNPVACIFVDDFESFDWRETGRELETHPLFPERTNAVFVKVLDQNNIELRIWERGAGETMASGTCSVASAIASCLRNETARKIIVHSPGGQTSVFWRESDDEMLLTGRADFVFCGEWEVK